MSEVTCRQARAGDAQALLALFHAEGWSGWWDESYARDLIRSAHRVVLAFEGDELVGTGTAFHDGVNTVLLDYVVVRSAFQRRGVGRAIVEELLRSLRGVRVDHLQLTAIEESLGFWEKMGFKKHCDIAMLHPGYNPPDSG